MSEVTLLLEAIRQGDGQANARLMGVLYDELRCMARAQMAGERVDHTLEATALVHEAYRRLLGDDVRWDSRGHFFAAAAEAMRRILVEHARAEALKRGAQARRVPIDEGLLANAAPSTAIDDLLDLDEALGKFSRAHPAKAELVKLLYFAGLSLDEAAAVQGTSRTTAYRHWQFARAWLFDAIAGGRGPEQEKP